MGGWNPFFRKRSSSNKRIKRDDERSSRSRRNLRLGFHPASKKTGQSRLPERATEGENEHGRTGSADGRRYDREEFSAVGGNARRPAGDPRKEVRHLAT